MYCHTQYGIFKIAMQNLNFVSNSKIAVENIKGSIFIKYIFIIFCYDLYYGKVIEHHEENAICLERINLNEWSISSTLFAFTIIF